MKSKLKTNIFLSLNNFALAAGPLLARGGGGGSGGGGGGGGGGGSFSGGGFSSHSSAGSSGAGQGGGTIFFAVWGTIFVIIIVVIWYGKKYAAKQKKERQRHLVQKEGLNWQEFNTTVRGIFFKFQKAWSEFDLEAMKSILTESYYKRMVLELNVLKNEKRSNPMQNVNLYETWLTGVENDNLPNERLVVEMSAQATDILMDTENNKRLFIDGQPFHEFWHFKKESGEWKLDLITQSTEDPARVEKDIATFAEKNNFYFDPDFGWLMMPNKGVLFSQTNFGKSDINNHVIGYFRDKIVEFYTYIPDPNSKLSPNYLVAQAILPISYKNILVKRKKTIDWDGWKLKRIYLESADFNKKFALWADPQDRVSSLELLSTNFMERIYQLPFDLNIEIVGNFLYLYTKDRGGVTYDTMLEILSWAFDEMKM